MRIIAGLLTICLATSTFAAVITTDLTGVKKGPISASATGSALNIDWEDAASHKWRASFSLDSSKPLITAITVDGRTIVDRAKPVFRCFTGKRRAGWDAFFDDPPAHPDGTRSFIGEFHAAGAAARTIGNRVEVSFDGMRLGIFSGSLRYVFYPGTELIQQVAVLSTNEPDTAYYYDEGLQMTSDADRRPGGTMGFHCFVRRRRRRLEKHHA